MMSNKPRFEDISTNCNFVEEEKKLIKHWYQDGVVKKYLDKNKSAKEFFSFLDGPITANNPMGVHHAWGRTYKDLFQRYKNMKGFKQRFQNGFDCQGLWVEVEVEKELGFKSKKDIDKYGVANFINKCKKRVNKYSAMQTQQTIRLGNFMDWDNSYYTMSDDNNYMIWHFLKECKQKNLIYKGIDVVPWCYRCETAISEHEILTEDYKDVEHTSIYFRLPITGRKNEFLLVWTTTPWTIPANIAVSVDGENNYSLVDFEGKYYWVMNKLVQKIFIRDYKILKTVKGTDLDGFAYTSAFDDLQSNKALSKDKLFHTVVITDSMIMPITEEEGTGLVHTSTGTGAEDHRLGKKIGLPIMPAIKDNADYIEGFGDLSGKNAKQNPELIFDILKTKKDGLFLFKLENYRHRYPACWRCKSELVWKLTDEWYIAIDPVREKMKKNAKAISWIPEFGLKRELDWLSNMHDWLISKKNRYWGLALPIWECDCGNFEVVGGFDELRQKAVEGWNVFEGHTPHKPFIDKVKIKCGKCGKTISRISDVGNPWLDAGIVPFSTISSNNRSKPLYITDKEEFHRWFPADFITESFPGQFKNWFYSVLAMSTILENKIPYKTVFGFATLVAEDGRPMHKSWGNSIEFNDGAEKIGADVMRWMFVCANPADNLLFGYKNADEVRRRFYLKLWNSYNFFVTYANLDLYAPTKSVDFKTGSLTILDKWILTRLKETLTGVDTMLAEYNSASAALKIEDFVNDFSNWYIRRSRSRVGIAASDLNDKKTFYDVSYTILLTLSKMLAPLLPFLSELIYTNLTKNESVHLEDWPDFHYEIDIFMTEQMSVVRKAAEAIHSERKKKNIAISQPLLGAEIYGPSQKPDSRYLQILLEETNLLSLNWVKKGAVYQVTLNEKITPELEEQAKTRKLVRKIQNARKVLGVKLNEKVEVISDWLPSDKKLLAFIKEKTLATELVSGDEFKVEK